MAKKKSSGERRRYPALIWAGITTLLLLSGLAAAGCGAGADTGGGAKVPASREEVPRVTINQLHREVAEVGDVLIVDNRTREEYAKGHIEGAVNVPLPEIEAGEWQPPEGERLVFY